VKDFYFSDQQWAVRYVVADTGSWLLDRLVLISPHAFGDFHQDDDSGLAQALLVQDESQILYYEGRLREMPIPVLKRHGIVEKDGDLIRLNVEKLSLQEKAEVRKICEERLQSFIVNEDWESGTTVCLRTTRYQTTCGIRC
jgi:hypothetical protein